jgi:hypothetical protein
MCRADPALTALSCCDLHTVPRIGIFVRGGHGVTSPATACSLGSRRGCQLMCGWKEIMEVPEKGRDTGWAV